jgi:hypothetical protein
MKQLKTLFRPVAEAAHPQEVEREAVNPLLFIGFVSTIFWTLTHTFIGNPVIDLHWIPMRVTLSDMQWIVGINLYIGLFWRVLYLMTRDTVYNWMFGCYLFAILEMFIVWDKPWFKFIGIPMTSNTLVFFGFAYAYIRNNWVRYIR